MKNQFALILFYFSLSFVNAQTYTLIISSTDNNDQQDIEHILKKVGYTRSFSSPETRNLELQGILFKLYDYGYLSASFDSTKNDSLILTAYLYTGKPYKWIKLYKGNVDESLLSGINYRNKLYRNRSFYYKDVRKLQEKILSICENTGYPFANIRLDSILVENDSIKGSLFLEKSKLVKIDSILIKGNLKIYPKYLYNYLSVKPGNIYNEGLIKKISPRIKELPFTKESKPYTILFTDKYTNLILYLKSQKASRFDGIAGFLPDNNIPGKVVISGEARLRLQNALGRGELFDLNWKTPQARMQDLKLRLIYPFLFSLPIGADIRFSLYKRDSLFIDIIKDIGLQYLIGGNNYIKAYVNQKNSSLLSLAGLDNASVLPAYADVSSTLYGLGLKKEKLDYRINPRKGYSIEGQIGVGIKNIQKNDKLNNDLYQGVKLKSAKFDYDYDLNIFIPILRRSTANIGLQGAHLIASEIFDNELYRFGGLKTLRGFDEESILATSFHILKVEYRYLLEQNSYLFAFWNGAYYENTGRTSKHVYDHPYGFGTGISFETRLGIFAISYALGKQFNNPIYFRAGKIHFGIINYF